jgi:hypothetical protein
MNQNKEREIIKPLIVRKTPYSIRESENNQQTLQDVRGEKGVETGKSKGHSMPFAK